MRIGPLAIAAFPSEVTKQMGLRIRNAVKAAIGRRLRRRHPLRPHERLLVLHGDARGVRRLPLRGQLHALRPPPGPALPRRRRGGREGAARRAPTTRATRSRPTAWLDGGSFPEPEPTPDAGTAVEQPAKSVVRYGRAHLQLERRPSGDRRPRRASGSSRPSGSGRKRWKRVTHRRRLLRHPRARPRDRRLDDHVPDDGLHARRQLPLPGAAAAPTRAAGPRTTGSSPTRSSSRRSRTSRRR